MRPKFSLIYTSVRSALIAPVVKLWLDQAKDPGSCEVILAVDGNDTNSQDAARSLEGIIPNYQWHIQPEGPFNCVKGWNLAATKARGDVFVQLTDDMVPPAGWDELLLKLEPNDWTEQDYAVHVEDGYVHDIMVLAIITRARYKRFGYFFYPDYESLFCLDPSTPVWMGDLSFKPLGDLQIGDVAIGTERRFGKRGLGKQQRSFLTESKIISLISRTTDRVKLHLASGNSLICTPDHFWAYRADGRLAGSTAKVPKLALKNGPIRVENGFVYGHPKLGRKLLHVIEPFCAQECTAEKARELGWLAGLMDGEGCFPAITQSLTANPAICAEIERLLTKYGFSFSISSSYDQGYSKKSGKIHHQRVFTLTGGKSEYVRFLNEINPIKKTSKQALSRVLKSRFATPDEIVSIEPLGRGPVCCLKTSTGNYVAGGYLSHNCDTELTQVAYKEGRVIVAKHLLFEHRHPDAQKRSRDAVDAVHASKERWERGEALFNHRKARGFPIDVGPKATAEAKNALPQPMRFCVYIQATRDDFCLLEVCRRLREEGVNDFFFSVPNEYWSGRPTPEGQITEVKNIAAQVRQEGGHVEVMVHKVASYRWPGDTRLRVETRVRNDALAYIKQKGFEHVLIVDGDELWRRGTLNLLTQIIEMHHPLSINVRMIPVVGLPGYPIDGATDVAVVYISTRTSFSECRTPFCDQFRLIMPLVIHFTGTRRTMDEIILKHTDSGHFDDPDYDFKTWIEKVLPNIKPGFTYDWGNGNVGLHCYKKYQIWPRVRHWMNDEIQQIPESLWPFLAIQSPSPATT